MASKTENACPAQDWLEEDQLMLLECWTRDGYTLTDIANKIGINLSTLSAWQRDYPEIKEALRKGREIVDYQVENALLKSALGYKTKEVKVTTTMRYGKVVETIKEVTDKEQAPNVSAIQCWLYNRCKDKWRNMNSKSNILDEVSEDTSIHVTVTRASKSNLQPTTNDSEDETDEEWQDEINDSIEIRRATVEEQKQAEREKRAAKRAQNQNPNTKVQSEPEDDLDYWPDDWEDEEDWED